jgi:molecular chaperone DnaJ
MSKDYYKILGIDKNASTEEVKKAFKKAAMQHHPDKPTGNEAKFKEANEAYQVLSDKEKRARYDQFGSDFEQQGGFGGGMSWEDLMRASRGQGGNGGGFEFNFGGQDFGDIFGDLFGMGGGRSRGGAQRARGRDIQVDVELDFKEAAFGVERDVRLRKQDTCDVCKGNGAEPGSKMEKCDTCKGQGQVVQNQRTFLGNMQTVATCPTCQGRGEHSSKKCKHCNGNGVENKESTIKVKIPAGIDEGQSIRITGKGEAAPHGGTSGDLYVLTHIKPSKEFHREDFDIYVDKEISYPQAVLGDTIEVPTLEGTIKILVPEGTESGQLIRLKGKGITHLGSTSRGDEFVRVKIKVPKKVSKTAKKLLEELKTEV